LVLIDEAVRLERFAPGDGFRTWSSGKESTASMFSSKGNLQERTVHLLSNRFLRTSQWMRKKLSPNQKVYFEILQSMSDDGRLWFVHGSCPCGRGARDTVVARRDRYGLPIDSVLCHDCGTVRLDPYFDESSLGVFYSEIYQELYGRSKDPVEYMERQRAYGEKILLNFESVLRSGQSRVLEIGCGAGGAIRELQQKGIDAIGCDYSRELIEFGTSQGVGNLICGTVESISITDPDTEKFDLIYLHHVLEHVGQPLATLERIQQLLKPDGQILIIVPDLFRVETHRISPSDCMELFHIAHKWNFSRECLSTLAGQLGMFAVEISPEGPRTAWTDGTEMWVSFQKEFDERALSGPCEGQGDRYLEYLCNAEQEFASRVSNSESLSKTFFSFVSIK